MPEKNPKITILLASHNRAHLIRETLDSILAQNYKNWECIIVDDHSIDNTQEVIKEYLNKDIRFSFFIKTDKYEKGLSGTRNYGLDLAKERKARYIQFFDDDDIMHPEKLMLQLTPFINNPGLHFTVCKFEKLIENQDDIPLVVKPEFKLLHEHVGDAILTGDLKMNSLSAVWNMEILDQFRFDETLKYAEEWELYIRIGYNYPGNYVAINKYLFKYRKHSASLTLGTDRNFDKRKTSSIIRIKILEYLTENNLHTKKSILFLATNFLIYSYNPNLVKRLISYGQKNSGSFKLLLFLKIGLWLGKFYRKIISKLATWV